MKRLSLMLVAGEASGDTLASELVRALREELARFQSQPTPDVQPCWTSLEPRFFGAGGPAMAAAGVEVVVDMTAYAVFGLTDVVRNLGRFLRLRNQLRALAIKRQPDVIICVDFFGFNRRLARAIQNYVRASQGTFRDWRPRLVQFVSPQVWASRPARAGAMARDFDLLLSIFPFEKAWYAQRVPHLRVEYVGHPMLDRYAPAENGRQGAGDRGQGTGDGNQRTERERGGREKTEEREAKASTVITAAMHGPTLASCPPAPGSPGGSRPPLVVLLPGSRMKEIKRHWPALLDAAGRIEASRPAVWRAVLPNAPLAQEARAKLPASPHVEVQVGGLAEVLASADLAIAASGTVTMECAYFGVPAVVLYKLSSAEFEIARRQVRVKHIAMPNLLAGEAIYPEFIQHQATGSNLAAAALAFLNDPAKREAVRKRLADVVASLGGAGAARRAARAVVSLLS